MKNWYYRQKRKYNTFKHLLFWERKFRDKSISLKDCLWLWKNGFNSFHKASYGLRRNNIHNYLSPYTYYYNHPYNGIYHRLIDNKAFLHVILPESFVCELHVVFENGKFKSSNKPINEPIKSYLSEYLKSGNLIYKPVLSARGAGFGLLNQENLTAVLNKIKSDRSSVLINEKVENPKYSQRIFPDSTNTVRILLMRDQETKKVFVLRAIHRFGTARSAPVDNSSQGGVEASIDIKKGILGHCQFFLKNDKMQIHPDTKAQISGVQIPGWEANLQALVHYFNSVTWLQFVGLDLVFFENGFKILEMNSIPDLGNDQFSTPYFSDPRVIAFFKARGVVKNEISE